MSIKNKFKMAFSPHRKKKKAKMSICNTCGLKVRTAKIIECPDCHSMICYHCFQDTQGKCNDCFADDIHKRYSKTPIHESYEPGARAKAFMYVFFVLMLMLSAHAYTTTLETESNFKAPGKNWVRNDTFSDNWNDGDYTNNPTWTVGAGAFSVDNFILSGGNEDYIYQQNTYHFPSANDVNEVAFAINISLNGTGTAGGITYILANDNVNNLIDDGWLMIVKHGGGAQAGFQLEYVNGAEHSLLNDNSIISGNCGYFLVTDVENIVILRNSTGDWHLGCVDVNGTYKEMDLAVQNSSWNHTQLPSIRLDSGRGNLVNTDFDFVDFLVLKDSPPTGDVNITFPPDGSNIGLNNLTDGQLLINITVDMTEITTCGLNDSDFSYVSNTSTEWFFDNNTALSPGYRSIKAECNGTSTISDQTTIFLDLSSPDIDFINPPQNDSKINMGELFNITCGDTNLFRFAGSVFYNDTGQQVLNWYFENITSETFAYNVTFSPVTGEGKYLTKANCSDSHTANPDFLDNKLNSGEFVITSFLPGVIEFSYDRVKLEEKLTGYGKDYNLIKTSYEQKSDRITTKYDFGLKLPGELKRHTITREISCIGSALYNPKSEFENHLICGDLWFDTDDLGKSTMQRIDENTVRITTKDIQSAYESKSVGIINTNFESQQFEIDSSAPEIIFTYPTEAQDILFSEINVSIDEPGNCTTNDTLWTKTQINYTFNNFKESSLFANENYNISVFCNDSLGNGNTSYISFNKKAEPIIETINPANGSYVDGNEIQINFTSKNFNLSQCSLYSNYLNIGTDEYTIVDTLQTGADFPEDIKYIGVHYDFEEGSGTLADDKGQYGNDGSLTNPQYVASKGDRGTGSYSMNFTSGTYLRVNDSNPSGLSNSLSFGDGSDDKPFSISAWVYMRDSSRFRVISKSHNIGANEAEYALTFNNVDKLVFVLYDDPASITLSRIANSASTTDENQWTHYAVTYDGSSLASGLIMYRNGALFASTDQSLGLYTAMHNGTSDFYVGTQNFESAPTYAEGRIDEVAVFNFTLSLQDIKDIYDGGLENYTGGSAGLILTANETMNMSYIPDINVSGYIDHVVDCAEDSIFTIRGNSTELALNFSNINDTQEPSIDILTNDEYVTILGGFTDIDYNATDFWGISSCDLYVEGTYNQTDSDVTNGAEETFLKYNDALGNFTYFINCTDLYTNTNISITQTYEVVEAIVIPPTYYNSTIIQDTYWFNTDAIRTDTTAGVLLYVFLVAVFFALLIYSEYSKIAAMFVITGLYGFFLSFLMFLTLSVILGVLFTVFAIAVIIRTALLVLD